MPTRAFSLIELIGVLAIIAIITALVLPRIAKVSPQVPVQTVHQANVTEVVVAMETLKTAVAAHLAQFGSLATRNGTPLNFSDSYDNFDAVLLSEGFIERPFSVSLATHSNLRLVRVSSLSATSTVDCSNGAYDLHGEGKNSINGASFALEAVLDGVTEENARALNDRIDGPHLGAAIGQPDLTGQVIYPKPGPDGRTEVHVYLLHK